MMIRCLLALMIFCTSVAGAADDTRALDVRASRATFTIGHLLIDHVTGTVPIVSAVVTLAADGVTPTAVEATLNPAHIDTGDEDRDGNLTGSDWFDTKKFPLWTFKSQNVVANADGTYAISGDLTIHGNAVPVTLATSVTHGSAHPGFHATTSVDRHAFGMVVTRTDALVGNMVNIVLDVQTK